MPTDNFFDDCQKSLDQMDERINQSISISEAEMASGQIARDAKEALAELREKHFGTK